MLSDGGGGDGLMIMMMIGTQLRAEFPFLATRGGYFDIAIKGLNYGYLPFEYLKRFPLDLPLCLLQRSLAAFRNRLLSSPFQPRSSPGVPRIDPGGQKMGDLELLRLPSMAEFCQGVQGSTIRPFPGCENAAGKLSQK